MINKISRCIIVFTVGVTLSLAAMAFFNQVMSMPQQAMTMGSQMLTPQQNMVQSAQPCVCECKIN
jgi:hypothetical protein